MAKKKTYSNVYTILDKARKGELVTSGPSSLFKSVTRYKRPDIISPNLHYLDEKTLTRGVNKHLNSDQFRADLAIFLQSKGVVKTSSELYQACLEIQSKFPKSLYNDFYNLFNKDISELTFSQRGKENALRYQFIEKANQPLHKIITIGSNVKSMVYTEHAMAFFMKVMLLKKFMNEPEAEQMMQQMEQEVQKACQAPSSGGSGSSDQNGDEQDDSPQDNQQPSQGNGSQDDSNDDTQDGDSQENDDSQQDDDSSKDDSQQQGGQGPQSSNDSGGNGAGKGQSQGPEEMNDKDLDKMVNSFSKLMEKHSKELEQEMEKAKGLCEKIDTIYSQEEQDDMWEGLQDNTLVAGTLDPAEIARLVDEFKKVQMGMNGVKQFIKKILDDSKSYFSSKENVTFEPLMETGHIDGLEDVYMLHPKLRAIFMDDMMVKETEKVGKINIYIDMSGSMSSSCNAVTESGRSMTRLEFCKAFAIKMQEMDLLNKVYVFDNSVYERRNTMQDILKIKEGGGTSIERVVQHIIAKDENAIVITDADDSCHSYSPKAYFIGTSGANFHHFNHLEQYRHQMCVFDGKQIHRVDSNGYVI